MKKTRKQLEDQFLKAFNPDNEKIVGISFETETEILQECYDYIKVLEEFRLWVFVSKGKIITIKKDRIKLLKDLKKIITKHKIFAKLKINNYENKNYGV